MDLQTRKLEVIGHLINIHDEKLFEKIETVINESFIQENKIFKQFTQQQLINRAEEANQDYRSGRIISQEDLEKESERW